MQILFMGIADLMVEVRKLPEDELLVLATQVEEVAARVVDGRFAEKVRAGTFDAMAAEALKELEDGKTVTLHEVLDVHDVS